ncbi:MAG: SGNH/GDSL hydrolase family protein [Verrucomicrobiales bacterium]
MLARHAIGCLLVATQIAVAAEVDDPATIATDNPNLHVRGSLGHLKHRLEQDKRCQIAFLGGSITENASGHSALVPARLRELYPDAEIGVTNAGWGSTCSTSGAFRLESQVFAGSGADLLVVEFAVNDDQDAGHARRECIRGMEGIVRRVRRDHPDCDIVMVQFVNPSILAALGRGEVPIPIAAHEAVAERYGVTSVNVAAELADAVAANRYSWKEYGGTHPGRSGYRLASNMIVAAIEAGIAEAGEKPVQSTTALPQALDAGSYDRGEFVDPGEAEPDADWEIGKVGRGMLPLGSIRQQYEKFDVLRGDKVGSELDFKFAGQSVGAFVLAGPDAGMVEASIDGGDFVRHDLYHRHSRGLNYPRSVMFATGLPPGEHSLKLRIAEENHPKSKGHAAAILFFEVSR